MISLLLGLEENTNIDFNICTSLIDVLVYCERSELLQWISVRGNNSGASKKYYSSVLLLPAPLRETWLVSSAQHKNNIKFTCSPLSDLLYFGSASLRHHFGGSTSKPLAPSAPPVQQRPCSSSSISCVSCIMQPVPSSKWKCLSEQRAGQRFRVTSDS